MHTGMRARPGSVVSERCARRLDDSERERHRPAGLHHASRVEPAQRIHLGRRDGRQGGVGRATGRASRRDHDQRHHEDPSRASHAAAPGKEIRGVRGDAAADLDHNLSVSAQRYSPDASAPQAPIDIRNYLSAPEPAQSVRVERLSPHAEECRQCRTRTANHVDDACRIVRPDRIPTTATRNHCTRTNRRDDPNSGWNEQHPSTGKHLHMSNVMIRPGGATSQPSDRRALPRCRAAGRQAVPRACSDRRRDRNDRRRRGRWMSHRTNQCDDQADHVNCHC